jgi:hypothetical protein
VVAAGGVASASQELLVGGGNGRVGNQGYGMVVSMTVLLFIRDPGFAGVSAAWVLHVHVGTCWPSSYLEVCPPHPLLETPLRVCLEFTRIEDMWHAQDIHLLLGTCQWQHYAHLCLQVHGKAVTRS